MRRELGQTVGRMLLIAMTSFPLVSHATLPATADQRLCGDENDNIVVAHVDHGTSEDCRLKYKTACMPDNLVRLSIVIDEVIVTAKNGLLDGRPTSDAVGRRTEILATTGTGPDYGDLEAPRDGALTDLDVLTLYVGKAFIFSIGGNAPHYATAWALSSRVWVMKTLQTSPFCATMAVSAVRPKVAK
jgi:hypothetical protein